MVSQRKIGNNLLLQHDSILWADGDNGTVSFAVCRCGRVKPNLLNTLAKRSFSDCFSAAVKAVHREVETTVAIVPLTYIDVVVG